MTALLLIAVVVLVVINGFFVAAEFALVRTRRARIEKLVEDGGPGNSKLVLKQLDDISKYLSACQLGITLASVAIGFLGEPAVAQLVEPAFGGLSHGIAVAISLVIAYVIVTGLHITVGEQVPKVFAIVRPEPVAGIIARPLEVFRVVMRPFVSLLNQVSNGILRILGIKTDGAMGEETSAEDIRLLIAESAGGALDRGEAHMLSGVFHLHEQESRQVMTPAPAVITVDSSETVETALRRCISSGHRRLVVTEENNADRVRGIVDANGLAEMLLKDGADAGFESIITDATIVPETKPLDDLLADLQRQHLSLAVVVDEYGRMAGLVTVEDIIEEIVGEIDDETDSGAGPVRQLPNGDWVVRGHVPVTDLEDYGLDLPADSDAYNSVGGFVFSQLGRLPKRGDVITANGYFIRVESVRENRIEAVRISTRRGGTVSPDSPGAPTPPK